MAFTKVMAVLAAASVLAGCAHNVEVSSQSGAAEVMSTRVRQEKAYLVFNDNIASAGKEVKPGFACGAHNYPMYIGEAIEGSLTKTVEARYRLQLADWSSSSTSPSLIRLSGLRPDSLFRPPTQLSIWPFTPGFPTKPARS
jgi:hypothetical protein